MPTAREWFFIFDFGNIDLESGALLANRFVRIKATSSHDARSRMIARFGSRWFQYDTRTQAGIQEFRLREFLLLEGKCIRQLSALRVWMQAIEPRHT
jgi:hypothetical protein